MVGNYVWRWPYYIEKMQFARHDGNNVYSNIPDFIYSTPTGLDIDNFINVNEKMINFFDIVKEELDSIVLNSTVSELLSQIEKVFATP